VLIDLRLAAIRVPDEKSFIMKYLTPEFSIHHTTATGLRCWKWLLAFLALATLAAAQDGPRREEVLQALRKATGFFRDKVSTHGGYHFAYAEDVSYGRSEHKEGPNVFEVQREGTPIVGLAYLEAYAATGDRYYLEAARATALALVAGQHCSGGWDYFIEFDPAERKKYPYRADGPCRDLSEYPGNPVTSLDDNETQAVMRFMARVDKALDFKDAKIHEATLYAFDSLIKAQYPNGAWPQRFGRYPDAAKFPVKKASYPESWAWKWPGSNYQSHYTFNDNSISDMIDAFLEAARIYHEPRYVAAAEKGGAFILLAQMPDPQPAWAQQYDADMHPAWARRFEPPAVTGGESQGVMRTLLVLYRETGNRKYLEPLPRALAYLKKSALPPVANPSEIRRRAQQGARNGIVLARFYELQSNKPLYVTKGTRVTVKNGSSTLLDGYELTYDDSSVITHYGVLTSGNDLPAIEAEYELLAKSPPASVRRPDDLHGLSPWSERPRAAPAAKTLAPRVAEAIASLDARGAWTEEGNIGKSDKIIQVFAAREMVLQVGKQTIPVKENDMIELFQGKEPPRERVIRSQTFAHNVGLLCDYLRALK
jgi:PelA/Pel-15E family pectate lyase